MIITPEYLAQSGTENGEQSALFCYAGMVARGQWRADCPADYRWGMLYAIPNGGKRGEATAGRLKATGVKAGFPDVGLPVARGPWHGLFIELKRCQVIGKRGQKIGGGTVASEQETWHIKLRNEGFCVEVCYGWIEAVQIIETYLNS